MSGLVSSIKNDVKKAGANKGKFIYIRPEQKLRVRFLQDMDDGLDITFHDSFEKSINVPCQERFDKECPYCEDSGVRTRSQYVWSVYNYDAKEVQLFMFPVNNCSPIPGLIAMYEAYGTLTDRDYIISVSGKGPDKSYSVVPMDKVKFRNDKAKPYSESKVLSMLEKAYPCDGSDNDDDDDDKKPVKKNKKPAPAKTNAKKAPAKDDEDVDDVLPPTEELEEMTAQKLYNLCKERDIECKVKKPIEYYVDLLEQWRLDNEDDYDDEIPWNEDDEEKPDYSTMTAKELYDLCKSKKITVEQKKPAKYYIKQLEDFDSAQDEWGNDDDENWEDE